MTSGIKNIGVEQRIASGSFARTAIDIKDGIEVVAADTSDAESCFAWIRQNGGAFSGTGLPWAAAGWNGKTFVQTNAARTFMGSRIYIPSAQVDESGNGFIVARSGAKGIPKGIKTEYGQACGVIDANGVPVSLRFFDVTTVGGRIEYDQKTKSMVCLTRDAIWYKIGVQGGVLSRGIFPGMGTGEKFDFLICPRGGQDSVWHVAFNGCLEQPSAYTNSLRRAQGLKAVTWASRQVYTSQGNDMNYMGLGAYPGKPRKAIIGGTFFGKFMVNIWTGAKMMFPETSLFVVAAANQEERHGPHFATVPGKTFASWRSGDNVMMVDVLGAKAGTAQPQAVAQGGYASIHASGPDSIGLVYTRGGALYRRDIIVE